MLLLVVSISNFGPISSYHATFSWFVRGNSMIVDLPPIGP